jgi:hypothetical protein
VACFEGRCFHKLRVIVILVLNQRVRFRIAGCKCSAGVDGGVDGCATTRTCPLHTIG